MDESQRTRSNPKSGKPERLIKGHWTGMSKDDQAEKVKKGVDQDKKKVDKGKEVVGDSSTRSEAKKGAPGGVTEKEGFKKPDEKKQAVETAQPKDGGGYYSRYGVDRNSYKGIVKAYLKTGSTKGVLEENEFVKTAVESIKDGGLLELHRSGATVPGSFKNDLKMLHCIAQLRYGKDTDYLIPPGLGIEPEKVKPGDDVLKLPDSVFKGLETATKVRQNKVKQAFAEKAYGAKIGTVININGVTYTLTERTTGKPRWVKNDEHESAYDFPLEGLEDEGEPTSGREPDREGEAEEEKAGVEVDPELLTPEEKASEGIINQKIAGPAPHVKLIPEVERSSLKRYQKEAVEKIHSAYDRGEKGFLLADNTGLGKTYTACGVIKQLKGKKNLVIVPSKNIAKGYIEADKNLKYNLNFEVLGTKDSVGDGNYIVTYAALRDNPNLVDSFDCIIPDESHNLSNIESSTYKRFKEILDVSVDSGGKVLYMSATPFQKLENIEYLDTLGLWEGGKRGFNRFMKRHGVKVTKSGSRKSRSYQYEYKRRNHRAMLALHENMSEKGVFLQRERRYDESLVNHFDVTELQESEIVTLKTLERAFKAAERKAKTGMQVRQVRAQRDRMTMRVLESMMSQRILNNVVKQLGSNPKAQAAVYVQAVSDIDPVETLKNLGLPPRRMKYLEGMLFKNPADMISDALEKLGHDVVRVYGKHSGKIEDYQSGKKRVVVASYSKAGTGVSLHDTEGTRPRYQHNASIPYSSNVMHQVGGRSHRTGSKSETNQTWYLPDTKQAKKFAKLTATKLRSMGAAIRGMETGDVGAEELLEFEKGMLG